MSVRRSLFRLANAGNLAAAIFLSKNLLGYRDVVNTEHTGAAGGPIEISARPNLAQLSDEELRQLRAIAAKTLPHEIDRELAARRLREFVRQAWWVVEPSTPFVPGWHIDAIIEHLEAITAGQIRNLLINVPPRHMKSLLVAVLWPAWEWIRWPERRWLYSS